MASPKDNKQSTYELQSGAGQQDKDSLIYLLKSRIFELEQNEKNYNALNSTYSQLQNELKIANEERLRTEYEMKQKTEVDAKKIVSLSSENDNFQQIINDKIIINKKLYADNETLLKQLYAIEAEFQELTNKWNKQQANIEDFEHKYEALNRGYSELNGIKSKQDIEIQKLFEDNRKLNSICKEKEYQLKQTEQDKMQLLSSIEEMSYELNNLKGKVKSKEENLSFVQSQNEDTKNIMSNLQQKVKAMEQENELHKTDLNIIQSALSKERGRNAELIELNEQLNKAVDDRERQIKTIIYDVDMLNKNNVMISEEKNMADDHNDRIQEQLVLLSKANNKLVSEIEGVIDQDKQIASALQRKDRIITLIKQNKARIEHSLNTFQNDYSKHQLKQASPLYPSGVARQGLNLSG